MDGTEEIDIDYSSEEDFGDASLSLPERTPSPPPSVECKLELKKRLVDAAAAAGNIECLQLLATQGYARDAGDTRACAAAAEQRQLAALKFLHERGWPWSTKVLYHAIVNNDTGVYQYAIENGCELCYTDPEEGEGGAVDAEYPGILQLVDAVVNGSLEVFKLIVEIGDTEGGIISFDCYEYACSKGNLRCLEYMDKESKRTAQNRAAGQLDAAEHSTLDDFCQYLIDGGSFDIDDACLAYIHETARSHIRTALKNASPISTRADRSDEDWRAAVRRVVYWPKVRKAFAVVHYALHWQEYTQKTLSGEGGRDRAQDLSVLGSMGLTESP